MMEQVKTLSGTASEVGQFWDFRRSERPAGWEAIQDREGEQKHDWIHQETSLVIQ